MYLLIVSAFSQITTSLVAVILQETGLLPVRKFLTCIASVPG